VIAQVYGRFVRDGFKIVTLLARMGEAFTDLAGSAKGVGDVTVKLVSSPNVFDRVR